MPGFDGTGPMGMGPMTGGGWGWCNPSALYGRPYFSGGFRPWFGWGRGRGYRHWYRATGLPGWMRSGPLGPRQDPGGYQRGYPPVFPYTKEQEMEFLKDQAAALKEELDAIDSRLRDLESEGQGSK
ncbi:MAG: DUF5320 domain-containing protein [Deltaproteobacteria bacterium]|nr:MAG: DUF5320 domain-containing protein [Deltaproteobacteria bacterium]